VVLVPRSISGSLRMDRTKWVRSGTTPAKAGKEQDRSPAGPWLRASGPVRDFCPPCRPACPWPGTLAPM
jgi:hypothetical protein